MVKIDTTVVDPSGSFVMDADHILSATSDLRALWRFHAPHAGYCCSPAIAEDGTIYFSTGSYSLASGYQPGEVYAVNPDGTLKWSYSSAKTFFSPAIGENGWICLMGQDYRVYTLSPERTLI